MQKPNDPQGKPGGFPAISQLTLSIPFAKGFADLYRPNRPIILPAKEDVTAGAIPAAGLAHDWRPSVWIGNTRRGLDWFAENWRGWRIGPDFETKAIEVENGPDGATLHIHFIRLAAEKPLVLDQPREIVFGMMATPPKTINRPAIRIGSGLYNAAHADKLPADVAAGMNVSEAWYYGDCDPNGFQGWLEQQPEQSALLAPLIQRVRDHGVQVVPYAGWYIHRKTQVYRAFGPELVVDPVIDGGCGSDQCCWNTPVGDAFLAQLRQTSLDLGYEGFRMDAGFGPTPCASLKHRGYGSVCGWHDDDGKLQPSISVFGAREAAKRAYRMYHSPDITEHGRCISHMYGNTRFAAIFSFMDAALTAEGAEMWAHSVQEFDMSYFRAGVMEDRYGLQLIYGPKGERLGYDARLAIGALHRLTPRHMGYVVTQDASYSRAARPAAKVTQAEDWVQWLDQGTEFYGYWENSQYLQTGRPELFGSFHVRRGEKLLLALFNREPAPVEQTVRLDLKALGFNGLTHAVDAVLDEPLAMKDGALTVTLAPESFRLVKIAAKPFAVAPPRKISENLIAELEPAKWPATGIPADWRAEGDASANAFAVDNGELVITGQADTPIMVLRTVKLAPDKQYVLEAEVRVDCASGVHLGPEVKHHFGMAFGGYYNPQRTVSSQTLPGRYETLRLRWRTTQDNWGAYVRLWLNGNGKVSIRKLGVYEVDRGKATSSTTAAK